MRQGELLGLKWSDINFEQGFATIYRQYTDRTLKPRCKTRSSHRQVDIPISVCKILAEHKRTSKIISEFIFVNCYGNILSPNDYCEDN